MASLLSILFVASSPNSGSRLLFSYPPNPVATPRVQRPLYGKSSAVRDAQSRSSEEHVRVIGARTVDDVSSSSSDEDGEDMFGSRFIRGESSSSSSSEDEDDLHDEYDTRELRERESYKVHLGLDTDVLGDLLCPRKTLCNRRFEMVINHLAFIAHPASARTRNRQPHVEPGIRDLQRARNESPFLSEDEDEALAAGNATGTGRRRGNPNGGDNKDRNRTLSPRHNYQGLTGNQSNTYNNGAEERGRSAPSSAFSSRRTSRSMPTRPSALKTSRDSSLSRTSGNPQNDGLQAQPGIGSALNEAGSQVRTSSRSRQSMHQHLAMSLSGLKEASRSIPASQPTPPSSSLPSADASKVELESWAIVLVIDSPPEQHLSYHLGIYYRDVVVPLMAALKYEERRSGYMTSEAAKIASMREKAVESGVPLTPHIHALCAESGLCSQLASLYHGLKKAGLADLTFNDDIDMSVLLHTELFDNTTFDATSVNSTGRPFSPSRGNFGNKPELNRQTLSLKQKQLTTAYDNHRLDLAKLTSQLSGGLLDGRVMHMDIAPWQTLLPLQDPEELLRDVRDDGHLARFLEIMSPTLTFKEYETLLDVRSEVIIEIAEHLIYWRKARLIDAVSLKCIYVPFRPSKPGDVKLLADWSVEFGAVFPDLPPLSRLLAALSTPQPFETLLTPGTRLRTVYLDALTWLLQHGLLIQLKVHMNLIATPEIKRSAYEKEEAKQKRRASSDMSAPDDEDGEGGDIDGRGNSTDGDAAISAKDKGESTNDSNFTISSSSSRRGDGLFSNEGDGDHASSDTRSPLPRSFPNSYPYISATSAAFAAKPTRSRLHGGKGSAATSTKERRAYLASLNAPSLIANPSEPTAEEELWINEIISQVEAEKGHGSTVAFQRMLPYIDGSHHLDEILYRVELSRKVIRTVLSDYDGYLVSFVQ